MISHTIQLQDHQGDWTQGIHQQNGIGSENGAKYDT